MMKDTIYAGELSPRVLSVTTSGDFKLFLKFNNGEKRVFDAKPLLSAKVFSKLKDPTFFKLAKVEHGTVVWPSDIDYCPDCLYKESVLL